MIIISYVTARPSLISASSSFSPLFSTLCAQANAAIASAAGAHRLSAAEAAKLASELRSAVHCGLGTRAEADALEEYRRLTGNYEIAPVFCKLTFTRFFVYVWMGWVVF